MKDINPKAQAIRIKLIENLSPEIIVVKTVNM